MGEGEYLNTAL